MKVELGIPPELVTAIAQAVTEELKPLIASRKVEAQDDILTPEQLAEYLQVSKQWVYERVSLGEIPHTKVGKYLRFRKTAIEKWIESQSIPATNPLSRSLKVIK
jgi:excisionase family DNA binding protein